MWPKAMAAEFFPANSDGVSVSLTSAVARSTMNLAS